MINLSLQIKLLLNSVVICKVIWVLNNFLTMEFYRKLCNRLYWKKLKPHTASYNSRFWMIIITSLTAIWLSFYYNPSDPANTRSSSFIINFFILMLRKSAIYVYYLILETYRLLQAVIKSLSFRILDCLNVILWITSRAYLKTASLRI